MTVRPHNHDDLCTPECGYRSLYQGSQSSLSDMASRQAEALGRHGRVRTSIIQTIRKTHPREFAQAEASLRSRLAEVDDQVLIAIVESLLQLHAGPPADQLEALRASLERRGVVVPDTNDLSAWASAIDSTGAPAHDPVAPAEPTPAATTPETPAPRPSLRDLAAARTTEVYHPVLEPVVPAEPTPAAPPAPAAPPEPRPAPLEPAVAPAPSKKTSSKKSPPASEPAPTGSYDPGPEPGYDDGDEMPPLDDLGDLFTDDDEGWDVSPAQQWTPDDSPTEPPATDSPATTEPERPAPPTDDTTSPSDDFLADARPAPEGAAPKNRPTRRRKRATDDWIPNGPAADPTPAPARTPWDPPTPADDGMFTPLDELDSLFDPEPGAEHHDDTTTAPQEPPPADETADTTPTAPAPTPLRPTLFPASTPKGKAGGRKKPRVNAEAPLIPTPPTPPSDRSDSSDILTDDDRAAFEAMVALPQPQFVSDLVANSGSDAKVAAWEEECRSMSTSPVRFIPTKRRHRARGALIIPYDRLRKASADVHNNWWSKAIETYRGGRLYEMAILLHRVGPQLMSFRFTETVAMLRLNQPRGAVGVCVSLSNAFSEGEPARDEIAAVVEELLQDRLDQIVVLSTFGEPIEHLVNMLTEEAAARNWQPTCRVVAGQSWSYADGTSQALIHVLG